MHTHPQKVDNSHMIFLSYARSDGKSIAHELRKRLIFELNFSLWHDVADMEGGRDWWQQIVEAIENVEYLVLVITPGALQSDVVQREWRLARQHGVCVIPIVGSASIDLTGLPSWMRRAHFVDPEDPDQWRRFVRTLESPCQTPRVPFMVEKLPEDFVDRPIEFKQLVKHLIDEKRDEPVAITAALRGAGGYGKTTLAKAICHDESVQEAFHDGILWITLGENPGDLTRYVEDLIFFLSGLRPGFSSPEPAAAHLAELLADRVILLVLDDVWNVAHLQPFMQGGRRCARLITTRNSNALPSQARQVPVDAMHKNEAIDLLSYDLPDFETNAINDLASRLGEWPLLLKIANGVLRTRVNNTGQSLIEALLYVNKALDRRGLTAFDARNPESRHQAVATTLGVSVTLLDPSSFFKNKQFFFYIS